MSDSFCERRLWVQNEFRDVQELEHGKFMSENTMQRKPLPVKLEIKPMMWMKRSDLRTNVNLNDCLGRVFPCRILSDFKVNR